MLRPVEKHKINVPAILEEILELGLRFVATINQSSCSLLLHCKNQTTKREMLVKVTPKRIYFSDPRVHRLISNEYQIAEKLGKGCFRVLQFEDFRHTKNLTLIIYRFPNMGNLSQYLQDNPVTDEVLVFLILDMVKACEELLFHRIVHRAIRLSHLFVHNSQLVFGGFEFCVDLKDLENSFDHKGTLDPVFIEEVKELHIIPPECLTMASKPNSRTPYFSLGCLLFFLTEGKYPQMLKSGKAVDGFLQFYQDAKYRVDFSLEKTPNVDPRLLYIFQEMLRIENKMRISSSETLQILGDLIQDKSRQRIHQARKNFFSVLPVEINNTSTSKKSEMFKSPKSLNEILNMAIGKKLFKITSPSKQTEKQRNRFGEMQGKEESEGSGLFCGVSIKSEKSIRVLTPKSPRGFLDSFSKFQSPKNGPSKNEEQMNRNYGGILSPKSHFAGKRSSTSLVEDFVAKTPKEESKIRIRSNSPQNFNEGFRQKGSLLRKKSSGASQLQRAFSKHSERPPFTNALFQKISMMKQKVQEEKIALMQRAEKLNFVEHVFNGKSFEKTMDQKVWSFGAK